MSNLVPFLLLLVVGCSASVNEPNPCPGGKLIQGADYSYASPVPSGGCEAVGLVGKSSITWCCQPRALPIGCELQSELVRAQLCPAHSVGIVCTDVAQTNPDAQHCAGPDWTDDQQVTGNAWCCDPEISR